MINEAKLRKRFEDWFESDAMPAESDWFRLDSDGDYYYSSTEDSWCGWKGCAVSIAWDERLRELLNIFEDFDNQVKTTL